MTGERVHFVDAMFAHPGGNLRGHILEQRMGNQKFINGISDPITWRVGSFEGYDVIGTINRFMALFHQDDVPFLVDEVLEQVALKDAGFEDGVRSLEIGFVDDSLSCLVTVVINSIGQRAIVGWISGRWKIDSKRMRFITGFRNDLRHRKNRFRL